MKNMLLSMSLRRKTQIIFLTMMLICLLFCFCGFYLMMKSKMETNAVEKDRNNRLSISKNLDYAIEKVNSLSRLIMIREQVTEYLNADEVTSELEHSTVKDIHKSFNSFDFSCGITIFRNDEKYVTTSPGITYINPKVVFAGWLDEVRAQKGRYIVKSTNAKAFSPQHGEFVTVARVINDINTQKEIGILVVSVPEELFSESYLALANEDNHFALYDPKGALICADKADMFGEVLFSKEDKTEVTKGFSKEHIKTSKKITDLGMYLITTTDVHLIEGITYEVVFLIVGFLVIIIIFILLFNKYFSKKVTVPIQSLVESMAQTESGWLKRVSISVSNDEIGLLKDSYNAMLVEINQLIDELVKKEKNLQQAELDALHEQMKPHFLYNTLDMIRSLAIEGNTEKVYELLETLGNFYRKFLSKGSVDIPLVEEINIVKNYLTLQKNRFEDVFEDEYDIEPGYENVLVPRLILQPMVENSIYHGLRQKGEKGIIKTTLRCKNNMLYLSVYDSGIGMDEDTIESMLNDDNSKSFGLKRTIDRIKAYYGEEDVFEVKSVVGEYCEIIFKLPIKEKENVQSDDNR